MANPRTIARLQERIKERAAYCLQFEVNDPRASFITVTRVELTHDFSFAKIYYSVLGDESDKSKAAHMLEHAGGFIQRQVARVLETRRVPHLRWIFDGSTEDAAAMDHLIHQARERDRAINPALGPENEFVKAREDQPAKESATPEESTPEEPDEDAHEPRDE
ncbi:MAG: 30S ribosome-binding factor RbfA [Planctomycetes bacterium]|nr:30S ribosome-binding factor RbfA [Planctomycetota bacterium]